MKRTILILTIFLISILLLPLLAFGGTYYVTQDGAGDESGQPNVANAMPIGDFNALTGTGYAGDTFYFSGTITSEVQPDISGTSGGGYVTLDGYEAGDCDPLNETCSSSAIIDRNGGSRCMVTNSESYLVIQDFRMTDATNNGIRTWDGSVTAHDHIQIKRCEIYDIFGVDDDSDSTGISFSGGSYITIGGASGDGNSLHNIGKGTGSGDVDSGGSSNNIIISYNKLYSTGNASGIDGIVFDNSVSYALIEYNTIFDHYETGGGDKGEDGIDIKGKNTHDIIVRYNHIYGNRQSGINTQHGTSYLYIYGNRSYSNGWDGIAIYQFSDSDDLHDFYAWSNILYDNTWRGFRSTSAGGSVDDVRFFNNIVAENGLGSTSDWTGLLLTAGTNAIVENNVFYKNRPDQADERQARYAQTPTLDYNIYYWPSETSQIYYSGADRTVAVLQSSYSKETHGLDTDPGLTNPENDVFTISASNSAVVDAGVDLSGSVNVTIQGVVYNVDFSTRLHPSTDWTTIPPTVIGVNDASYGSWNIGAYEWVSTGNQAPNSIITSPATSNPTIDKTETVLFSGLADDPEDDTCTYAWTWEADSMAIWADATEYDAEPTTITEVSLVLHGGVYYKCIQDHTSETGVIEPPNASYWTGNANTLATPGRAIFNTEVGSPFAYSFTVTDDAPLADPTPASGSLTVNDPEGGSPPTTVIFSKNTVGDYAQTDANYDEGDGSFIWYLYPETEYGSHAELWVEHKATEANDYHMKSFLSFSLAYITGQTVTGATLGLRLQLNPQYLSTNIEIWSCADPFVEADLNWNVYDGSNSWTGVHGKTTFLAETAFTTSSAEDTFYTFSGEALKSYLGTVAATGGTAYLLIIGDIVSSGPLHFDSDDATDGWRPYLSIDYGSSDPASVPEVISINIPGWKATYKEGEVIPAPTITWSEPVVGTSLVLTLDTDSDGANDATSVYVSGSGTATQTLTPITVTSDHHTTSLDSLTLTTPAGVIAAADDATEAPETDNIIDTIPLGVTTGSLAYNTDIAIDTSAPTISSVNNTDSHCTADSTISAVGTLVKFAIVADSTGLVITAAPGFPRIEMNAHPIDTTYAHYVGVGDTTGTMIFGIYTTAGMRIDVLNFTGNIDLGVGGSIKDAADNTIDVDIGALTLVGEAAIVLAVPYPSTSPAEYSSSSTIATAIGAGMYFLPNDFIECTTANSVGTVDLSGEDGTDGNPITIDGGGFAETGSPTFGDWWVVKHFIFN